MIEAAWPGWFWMIEAAWPGGVTSGSVNVAQLEAALFVTLIVLDFKVVLARADRPPGALTCALLALNEHPPYFCARIRAMCWLSDFTSSYTGPIEIVLVLNGP